MPMFSRRRFIALASLSPLAEASAQLIGNSGDGWSIRGTDPIEIFHGERKITSYLAGYDLGRPYFNPVVGPSGEILTRSTSPKGAKEVRAPGPEGLWFALGRVNGYNFRGDPGDDAASDLKPGVIRHRGVNGIIIKGTAVVLRTRSEWLDAADPTRRICSDRREFTLFYREDGSLVIGVALELMADAGDLEIGAETVGAWTVRLAPGLVWKTGADTSGMRNSAGLLNGEVPGKRAAWVGCHGLDAAGNPAGVAILDHPSNPGHPAAWSIREDGLFGPNPFPEASADAGDPGEPIESATPGSDASKVPSTSQSLPRLVPNGESLFFRYRTLFHRGATDPVELAKAFEAFSAR